MEGKYKKKIKGHIVMTIRKPIEFEVDAEQVEYDTVVNDNGEIVKDNYPHLEEEYEYCTEVYQQDQKSVECVKYLKMNCWDIEEIAIEEC